MSISLPSLSTTLPASGVHATCALRSASYRSSWCASGRSRASSRTAALYAIRAHEDVVGYWQIPWIAQPAPQRMRFKDQFFPIFCTFVPPPCKYSLSMRLRSARLPRGTSPTAESALDMSSMFKPPCAAVFPCAAALTFHSGKPPICKLHHAMRARKQHEDSASGMCE